MERSSSSTGTVSTSGLGSPSGGAEEKTKAPKAGGPTAAEETSKRQEEIHRKLASTLFNLTWELMEKEGRTADEDLEMVHTAHASRCHWSVVGGPQEWAIGEWQISRVYSLLNRQEPAIYHARCCLKLCLDNEVEPFCTAYSYEALARAYSLNGDVRTEENLNMARQHAEEIKDETTQAKLLQDLDTIESSMEKEREEED